MTHKFSVGFSIRPGLVACVLPLRTKNKKKKRIVDKVMMMTAVGLSGCERGVRQAIRISR